MWCGASVPIQVWITESLMATRPKIRKNGATDRDSSSTWDDLADQQDEQQVDPLPPGERLGTDVHERVVVRRKGVPTTARCTTAGSSWSLTAATSSGSRTSRKPTARAPKNAPRARAPAATAPSRPATPRC